MLAQKGSLQGQCVHRKNASALPRAAAAPLRLRLPSRGTLPVCATAIRAPKTEIEEANPQGKDLLNRSYYPTGVDSANVTKKWYIIDAEGQTLGRLACLACQYIRGKHNPTYTPSMDMGAYVVVINADKVKVTGSKYDNKTYFNHVNARPGSWRVEAFKDLQRRLPERIIERAVKGMLPKGRLGRNIRTHLKVFKGPSHPHEAQKPADITSEIDLKPKNGPGAALLASKKQ
ncbi:ribosomal protein L13 [Dunaliella salina]|uniref:Ribosomal protein L13 n=1 Tax=Dunaliella salina TaxID=3046 RepID=A0ABQ7GDJ1_DUNSA|nr:ribosomal protein L13 [Dunaliella salina]|eukprot:KAF5832675.1 ribosomal protein L13 [Dunaliella salina]